MIISSRQNDTVKLIRSLRLRKARDETGLFFVEGMRLLDEAIQQRAPIETLVVAPQLLDGPLARRAARIARRSGAPRLEVTPDVFESLCFKDGYQGIGAVLRQRWHSLDQVRVDDTLGWVALSAIGYPFNLGTILRVCDSVGGAGVLLIGSSTDPYDPIAVRASLGAVFSQQLVRTGFEQFAAWTRRHGYLVVGTSPGASTDYREVRYRWPAVLLMGSERVGLSAEHQAACDVMIRIPMVGRCPSHHVAVATSIVLYEMFQQRRAASQCRREAAYV